LRGSINILFDKTFELYNIDCSTLSSGSHKKVIAECDKCGEQFNREWRLRHQKHSCSTHSIRDGLKVKWCSGCDHYLAYDLFSSNAARVDNLSSYCKTCSNRTPSSSKRRTKLAEKRKTLEGWIKWQCARKKSESKKHGIPFDLDHEFLESQWEEQEGLCFYSKLPMTFGMNSIYSASLERRDPTAGYLQNNVVWSTKAMNWAKNTSKEDEFKDFLLQMGCDILEHPVRLECKLLNNDAVVPTRSRSTDAGYDLSSVINVVIPPGEIKTIDTGIAVSTPPGFYYTIDGRSSLWMKGILPFRGIIDATYTGPLVVVLMNTSDKEYKIDVGDRIAQMIVNKITHCDISVIDEFSPGYDQRGLAGFGSSGK